jgi:hypothetical protein
MYLINLAAIARSTGLTVVERSGWQSRGHGGMIDVRAIVCHHTGTTNTTANAPSLAVVEDGRSDLPGPLSHFLLARDGTVYVVAAGLCYHAGSVLRTEWGNAHTIGIEAEATGLAAWPEVQLRAYAKLCRALSDTFGVPVLGHKEVCAPVGRKIDPNFDMGAFRARVRTTNPEENDMQLTDRVHLFDKSTVTVEQLLAGLFSRAADPVIESQRFPGHKDTLDNFVSAIDANVLGLADGVKALTNAQQQTNAKLNKLIELLTPKEA